MNIDKEQIINLLLKKIDDVINENRVIVYDRGMLGVGLKHSKNGNYLTVHTIKKELCKKQLNKLLTQFTQKDK